MITIVVPCFNEEQAIDPFYDEMQKIKLRLADRMTILFIDDGSKDGTLKKIKRLANRDSDVHYVSFSRNFGKEAAILAGLERADGEYVALMDVDLQDPPELLLEMYQTLKEEEAVYDCVAARRIDRHGEKKIRSFFSNLFYKLANVLSDMNLVSGSRDYRIMSRRMTDAIINDKEYNRFSKGLFAWVGFETKWIEYENINRRYGETKWSFLKLFKYAIDGILAYSLIPLSMASWLGIGMCGVSFIMLLLIVGRALLFGDPVAGWPSLVSIIVFIGGMILLSLGIIGLYISRIYLETKGRQIYIVKEQG